MHFLNFACFQMVEKCIFWTTKPRQCSGHAIQLSNRSGKAKSSILSSMSTFLLAAKLKVVCKHCKILTLALVRPTSPQLESNATFHCGLCNFPQNIFYPPRKEQLCQVSCLFFTPLLKTLGAAPWANFLHEAHFNFSTLSPVNDG